MSLIKPSRALLGAAIAAALLVGGGVATSAVAAPAKQAADAKRYPSATRTEPAAKDARTTQAYNKPINDMIKTYQDPSKNAANLALVDKILADPKANAYDKSFSAQLGGLIANKAGDNAKAIAFFRQGLDANGLDNNGHFEMMYNMGIVQTQSNDFAGAAATFQRFLDETKSNSADARYLLAQNEYEQGKFAQAAANAKIAIDGKPDAPDNWKQLYMLSLNKSGNSGAAIGEAKAMADKNPNDKKAQMNYAALLLDANRNAEALAVMQKMRAAKLLTTDADYRNLFIMLSQQDGQDKAVIDVINEGLASKVLTQDGQVNLALAQAYFYTDQEGKAIEYFEKAAPDAKSGSVYMNLARIYWQRGENVKAKDAVRKAQAKGISSDNDKKTSAQILALPDKGGSTVILQKKK